MCVRYKRLYPVILISALLIIGPVCTDADAKKAKPKAAKAAAAAKPATASAKPAGNGGNQLQRRIDFGNSYILGQSIKSGAVYLLHRKKSEIKSMLHYRENYRDEILESFSVDADSELQSEIGENIKTESLVPMTPKLAPMKKMVLK